MIIQDDGSFQEPGYAVNQWCPTGDPFCNLNLLNNNGPGAVRIIIYWANAAPNPGCTLPSVDLTNIANYNQTYVNRVAQEISNAQQMGLAIYLAFGGPFPCWASLHPNTTECPNPSACTNEPDPNRYADFVHAFAARFGSVVSRWSPYNEPDNSQFLTPQTTGPNAYTSLIYRRLWFVARAQIQPFSSAPLWFGETAGNGATASSATAVTRFIAFALCRSGIDEVTSDPAYPSCSGTNPAPTAEALTFHFYGDASLNPQSNLAALNTMSGILLDNQAAGAFPSPGFIAETEHGWKTSPNGVSDATQSQYINCDEENAYKNHQLVATAQYEMQDPPPGRGGDLHTGMISQSVNGAQGVARPSLFSWIQPITVFRKSDGTLEVWGAMRADYMPHDTVTIQGLKSGAVTYSKVITIASTRYYHATLTDAPTGLVWRAVSSNGAYISRTATGTDCGTGWTGGNPAH